MDPKTFDYSPLTKQYSNRELWAHFKKTLPTNKIVLAVLAAVIIPTILFFQFLINIAASAVVFGFLLPSAITGVRIVAIILIDVACPIGIYYALWRLDAHYMTKNMRNQAFATANGLQYLRGAPDQETGMLFSLGNERMFTDGFVMAGQERLTVANYQYTTGSGKSRHVHEWGIIRCDVSRKLPNILLDATSNNFMKRFSNLGNFGDDQKIELEGDFNQYFNVRCPTGYGTDTLYWLTPELMQLLKKYMAAYDIEVIDNHVYAYREKFFELDQTGIQNGLLLANWLYAEFEQNTHRYSDERVANPASNVISEPGRRLRRKTPWVIATITFIYLALRIIDILTR